MQIQQSKSAPTLLFGTVIIQEVEMEVVFGTPSKNCSGAGVCLIAGRFPEGYKIACSHAPARIHFLPGNELVFRFRKHALNNRIIQRYFKANSFLVEEPFQLPRQLVDQWSLPVQNIAAGQYPVQEFAQEWRLYFTF